MSARALLALLLGLGALPAAADVVLHGNFHTGNDDNAYTPTDPVDCNKYRAYPTRFSLTQSTTITSFTLHDAVGLDVTDITVDINGTPRNTLACAACLVDGTVTIDLIPDVTLSAADNHTVAVFDPSGSSANCDATNDFTWSKLTLNSAETTNSVMLVQRRHAGDNDDGDDDYDFAGNLSTPSSQFYPDAVEAAAVNVAFTLGSNLRLTQVNLSRLRDVNTASGSHATVDIDGKSIGSLTGNGDPFTLSTALLLASGAHTITVTSGTLSGQRDDISWDGVVLKFSDVGSSGQVGFFNAVDTGANSLTGKLTTKIAGGAFSIDLYAMNGFGTGTDTSYAGSATVDVLDASNSSGSTDVYGCNSSWTVAQSLGAVTFSGGQAVVAGTFLDAGLKNARIRVTDSTTQARGCSIDNFAIRPDSFNLAPSQGSETTAGLATALTNTATSGLPRHKAGRPFTLVVAARGANNSATTGYDGSPTITSAVLAPATVAGSFTFGGTWASVSGGVHTTDNATYSEVGAMTLTASDASWADVDSGDGSTATQRTITGTVDVGRFIPDRFNVTEGALSPACPAGGFSYIGDTLNWFTPYAAQLTAVSFGGTTTVNYSASTGLESLPATLASSPTYLTNAGIVPAEAPAATPTVSDAVAGVANIVLPALQFTRGARVAAFDAEIEIALPAFTDGDNVAPNDLVLGATTTGNGIAFDGGGKAQRFGRLYFEPTYGSEMLNMQVPLRAEYFDGTTFVPNTADSCTSIGPNDVTIAVAAAPGQTASVGLPVLGVWPVTVSAPLVPGTARLNLDAAGPGTVASPNLAADTDNNGSYSEDPETTVTFGVYSQEDRRIFQREVIGN